MFATETTIAKPVIKIEVDKTKMGRRKHNKEHRVNDVLLIPVSNGQLKKKVCC